jgi:hypothetical protein
MKIIKFTKKSEIKIHIPIPGPNRVDVDKSKYNRKPKHKKEVHENV